MSSVQDYLGYVSEVLGARQILTAKPQAAEASVLNGSARTRTGHWPPAGTMDLVVLHRGEGLFSGATGELWDKMKAAMKIGSRRILELESTAGHDDMDGILLEALSVYPASAALVLTAQPARTNMRSLGTFKVIETFAPSILVESPGLKREAWSDLQSVMTELGLGKN